MRVRTTAWVMACAGLVAIGCGDDDASGTRGNGAGNPGGAAASSGSGAHAATGGGGRTHAGSGAAGMNNAGTDGASTNHAGHDAGAASTHASGDSGTGTDTGTDTDTGTGTVTVTGEPARFGPVHMGSYNLGPVDWTETVFHNSCAPYPSELQTLIGPNLAGVDNSLNGDGSLCDACAIITTRLGKSLLVHIVTTGVSKAPGDMDLSPEAYAAIHEDDPQGTPDLPRPMSWQLATCQGLGNVRLQYQTQANPWWTSLWVRAATRPTTKVEVKSANHADFFALRRETNGTWNDDGGFGMGGFELRISGDGAAAPISAMFDGFEAGALVDTGKKLD